MEQACVQNAISDIIYKQINAFLNVIMDFQIMIFKYVSNAIVIVKPVTDLMQLIAYNVLMVLNNLHHLIYASRGVIKDFIIINYKDNAFDVKKIVLYVIVKI